MLIVDDENDITEFAKNFFKKRKIEVFTASGGNEAFEVINKEQPDLVLLDVRMEEMNGVDLLQKLKNAGKTIKVVMVSGIEDEETVKKIKEFGVIGFIHKPLVLEELEKVVLKELGK